MKTKARRLNGVAENLDLDQRIKAALAAVKAEDMATLKNLYKTSPRKVYEQADAEFANTMDAAQMVGLRTDRAFGWAVAERWKATFLAHLGTGDNLENADPERMVAVATAWANLMIIVTGCDLAAERLGLEIADLMAFSAWFAEDEWQKVRGYKSEVVEEGPVEAWIQQGAKDYADALLEIWLAEHGRAPVVQQWTGWGVA